jgi:D-hexose-6-phosphate mutarotase
MNTITDLERRFSIPGVVKIEPGAGGLTRVAITGADTEAEVYLQGAHVTRCCPRGGRDVLFTSAKSLFQPGKAIRGGVPLIFPWFGAKAGDAAAPMHGFARATEWSMTSATQAHDGSVSVVLELAASDATRKAWPHEFALRYTVKVGPTLDLTLEVTNKSAAAFTFEEALHTYLTIGDVRQAKIDGLAGRDFLDKTDGLRRKTQPSGPFSLDAETDRVYLNSPDTVTVTDAQLGRRLIVAKEGSKTTVLWNPWIAKAKAMADFGDEEWPGMVCVETANAAENAVTLDVGKTHKMLASIAMKVGATKQWEMSGGTRQ